MFIIMILLFFSEINTEYLFIYLYRVKYNEKTKINILEYLMCMIKSWNYYSNL